MNERKSVLFACYGLGIGGIEKCLVNLINVMPEDQYDIDLLIMNPEYDMLPMIRRNIQLVDAFSYILNTEFTMQEIRKRGGLWKYRHMLLPYLEHRVRIKLGLPLWTQFRSLEKEYDIAVAYSQNGLAPYYVIDKVQSKRKVLWYHNGAYEKTGKAYAADMQYYPKFDYVVAVSENCAQILKEKFSDISQNILCLYNICDRTAILQGADAYVPSSFESGKIHVTTVGRLSPEKGLDIALDVCELLKNRGMNICWHWVGDGPMMAQAHKMIIEKNLTQHFLLHGNQSNPYPYMQCADIYVQPSHYEGFSTTITEAKVLCKPIVATDVGSARIQLHNGETGIIVPVSVHEMAVQIEKFQIDQNIGKKFSEKLKEEMQLPQQEFLEYTRTVFA